LHLSRFVAIMLTGALAFCLCSITMVTAGSDFDQDGISDEIDPVTELNTSLILEAGEYSFKNLVVEDNAIITLKSNLSRPDFKGVKILADNFTLAQGSTITADGQGYPEGQGPGAGGFYKDHNSYGHAGGGSYGGLGTAPATTTYGSALHPGELGSGGGQSGAGGGAIQLIISDTIVIDGNITANGFLDLTYYSLGAGGSGGSIFITSPHFSGSGIISANGAAGKGDWGYSAGSGGGGRIAIYSEDNTFNGIIEANGIYGSGNGTVAFIDTLNNILTTGNYFRFQEDDNPIQFTAIRLTKSIGETEGKVQVSSDIFDCSDSTLTMNPGSEFTHTTVNCRNTKIIQVDNEDPLTAFEYPAKLRTSVLSSGQSEFVIAGPGSLSVDTLTLTEGSTLTTLPERKIELILDNLMIDSGSAITADGKGYPPGRGPGAGQQRSPYRDAWTVGGGSYGGNGTIYYGSFKPSAPTYGSSLSPEDFGSGSGLGGEGNGGGAVTLQVRNSLTNNGVISADGDLHQQCDVYAGGSGGSVHILTNRIQGSGSISANGLGGKWGYKLYTGSGGGGRIAIYSNHDEFTGNIEVKGEFGAENGTVVRLTLGNNAPITGATLQGEESNPLSFFASIRTDTSSIQNGLVSGDLRGTMPVMDTELVTVSEGAFEGTGFCMGNWSVILNDIPYKGTFSGVIFTQNDNTIQMKGRLKGDLGGIIEGTLTENNPLSGIFDRYSATWSINRIQSKSTVVQLQCEGILTIQDTDTYPSTELELQQFFSSGTASGAYSGPLDTVVNEVRILDPQNPYAGKGFSLISYNSNLGSGSGWTYDEVTMPSFAQMNGMLSEPLKGPVTGSIDSSLSPATLSFILESLSYGSTPQPELHVKVWGPKAVSPGQRFNYIIEISNLGPVAAENASVRKDLSPHAVFIDSSENSYFNPDTNATIWVVDSLPPQSKMLLQESVETRWGLLGNTVVEDDVTLKYEDQFTNIYYPGINWDKDNSNEWNSRYENAHSLDSTLARSYLGTDALSGALHVFLASKNIPTTENYLAVNEDGTSVPIAFSHSGGTQTLYQKIAKGEIKVDYAVFAAPALLNQQALAELISSHKVQKIIIIQSPQDVLYNIGLKIEREHKFTKTSGDSVITWWAPAINVVDAPYIGGLLKDQWYDISGILEENNIDPQWLPESEEFYIGGDAGNQALFENQDVDGDGKDDIICHTIDTPIDPLEMHTYLNIEMINRYLMGLLCGDIPKPQISPNQVTQFDSFVQVASDPNVKYGTEGRVSAGQKLDYRIEYENIGDGIAYGVYFTDTLDEDLDDTSLSIGPVYSTADGSQIALPGTYNPATRTITWRVGEVASHAGGYANFTVSIRNNAPDWTEIINYATVYFPSVPEETRTNGIVSIVGYNRAPVIEEIPELFGNTSELLSFQLTVSDPDNDPLTFYTELPPGATFEQSGSHYVFSWTPLEEGLYYANITVDDGRATTTLSIPLTILKKNHAPQIEPIADCVVREGEILELLVIAHDPDGDVLTFVAEDIPENAEFDTSTHIFHWIPDFGQVGDYVAVFNVTDSIEFSWGRVNITVTKGNLAPNLDPIGNYTVQAGENLEFAVSATDPDGDTLTFSAEPLPAGATFDALAHVFSWTPDQSQCGETEISFFVTDGLASDSETITITVQQVSDPSEQLHALKSYIEGLNLQKGTENSLLKKIENALKSLEKGNIQSAKGQLNAFINEVNAQSGKKIPSDIAGILKVKVQEIIQSIS